MGKKKISSLIGTSSVPDGYLITIGEYIFGLYNVRLYLDREIVIDVGLRSQLEAFAGKDPIKNWGWFVQSTHKLTKKDFLSLTGQKQ